MEWIEKLGRKTKTDGGGWVQIREDHEHDFGWKGEEASFGDATCCSFGRRFGCCLGCSLE